MKKIVAPIPAYLLVSVGHFSSMVESAPEQSRKKEVSFFIYLERTVIPKIIVASGNIMPVGEIPFSKRAGIPFVIRLYTTEHYAVHFMLCGSERL